MPRMTQSDYEAFLSRTKQPARSREGVGGVDEESELHEAIISFCESNGWLYFHGAMCRRTFRTLGEFDFTVLADHGRVFFIECKSKTGKLSKAQLDVHAHATKLGHKAWTVRSMQEFKDIVCNKL